MEGGEGPELLGSNFEEKAILKKKYRLCKIFLSF